MKAGQCRDIDRIVFGDERALILETKVQSAVGALESFQDIRDQSNARHLREQVEYVTHKGTQILAAGNPTASAPLVASLSDVQRLLGSVISERSTVACGSV